MMRRQQAARLRLAWLLWLMALPALVLASASCTRSSQAAAGGHEPTAVVIFVDFSDSVGGMDRTGFKREIDKLILPWLEPGDSFLIAPINDKTLTGFRPLVEAELPARPQFNGFMNNVMKFNREAKATEAKLVQVKETIRTQTGEALSKTSQARYTDIFSSLLLAEKLFSAEQRRKVLILMTDMIEDYPPYAFDRMAWAPQTTGKILRDLEGRKAIADLRGVCVYVSGVNAPTAEMATSIARFWEAYFWKAGADLHPSRYAHVLLHWPPPSTCRVWGDGGYATPGRI
ncbi:MAG: hypothetical protein DMD85_14940 [Candidatus Rokuibacteriota bacterium]|nr:MAG: hypothetical protein DMD85_14940 [Candidatus Rokubacteria bacterium]